MTSSMSAFLIVIHVAEDVVRLETVALADDKCAGRGLEGAEILVRLFVGDVSRQEPGLTRGCVVKLPNDILHVGESCLSRKRVTYQDEESIESREGGERKTRRGDKKGKVWLLRRQRAAFEQACLCDRLKRWASESERGTVKTQEQREQDKQRDEVCNQWMCVEVDGKGQMQTAKSSKGAERRQARRRREGERAVAWMKRGEPYLNKRQQAVQPHIPPSVARSRRWARASGVVEQGMVWRCRS